MNIAELKTKIVMNEIPNILVFTGEEMGIMDIYIKAIQDKLKYQVSKIDTVLDAFNLSSGRSIFKVNKLFICVDDLTFLKQEEGWDNLSKVLGDNKIILKYHNYDARLGFWKKFQQETVIFERMNNNILAQHLSKEYDLSIENAMLLGASCNNDYIRCKLELDKVNDFANSKSISMNDAFKSCYNNVLCLDVDSNVFEFVNSVLTRNYTKILIFYSNLKAKNEPVVKLLSLLYNGFKNLLIAQTITSSKNIQQNTGLNYYSYIKAKEISGYYNIIELENILYIIMELEQGIKTGIIDDSIAIDLLFKNL